jgi:NAD(P)-dependent dehydrogenase (short-subunit alcohol dehydrogenase family)
VTGGGRGIGRALALALAQEGADVAVSSRTRAELEAVAGEIAALGRRAQVVEADALVREQVKASVAETIARFGKLDILVNNVGGGVPTKGPEDTDPFTHDDDVFAGVITLNLTAQYWATRAALPAMRERGYGRVINIGSGYAKRSGGPLAYSAAKHGMIGFTRALAAQVAPYGITVNCLCPGWTNTRLIRLDRLAASLGTDVEGAKRRLAEDNLLDRILEPEELGPMCALLAAPESGGITGQVISVDGGYKV